MVWTQPARCSQVRAHCSNPVACWRSRSTSAAPLPCAAWAGVLGGASRFMMMCSVARVTRSPYALRALHKGGLVLEEKAEDLGRVLGQTEEYKALRRATEALRDDQAVQKVLAEAERLAQEIERVAQQGNEPTKEQVEQYDRAL